jgi:hypothetical protein
MCFYRALWPWVLLSVRLTSRQSAGMPTLTQTTGVVMACMQVTHAQGVLPGKVCIMHDAMWGIVVCSFVSNKAAVLCWQQAAAQRTKVMLFLSSMSAFRVSDCWWTGKMCLQVSIDACRSSQCVCFMKCRMWARGVACWSCW